LVGPASDLDTLLTGIVEGFLLGAPGALSRAKAALAKYSAMPISDAMFGEVEASFREQLANEEAQEGRLSFREKRKPSWYPQARDVSSK
jgi:methylglutaconyl-CoA hydratase